MGDRLSLTLEYQKEGVGEFGEVPSSVSRYGPIGSEGKIAIERAGESETRPLFFYTPRMQLINPFSG